MPTTLTLKNIPVLLPEQVEPVERIARARALRAGLPKDTFEPEEIDAFKREGRA